MSSSTLLLFLFTCIAINGEAVRDIGNQPTIIETDKLPLLKSGKTVDSNLMPLIGNGHIATTIYNDTVYMNGVYSGRLSDSHRARIPAEINLRVGFRDEGKRNVYRQYRLDMRNGYWEENSTVEECRVTQRVYAHQFYTRLLVTEIIAQRQGTATGNLMIYLNKNRGENSKDINFKSPESFNGGNWMSEGNTTTAELEHGHTSLVHTFWSMVPSSIHIPSHQNSIRHVFIMSIDTNKEIAKESYVSGSWLADKNPMHFFDLHQDGWNKKWAGGGIQLSGNMYLEKLSYSSFYYLLSSLPSLDTHRELNDFGGISSGGLANGGPSEPERGHVGWDQEKWIFPAMLSFYPSLAKSMLKYRINTMPAAAVQAQQRGYLGLLYSWKSAATGIDVTSPYEPRNHYHLNGDISFAMRQYTSVNWDRMWLEENGACNMIKDLAVFWYSKLKWNEKTGHYDVKDVTIVDGTMGSVDNSVYTNAVASLALHYSKYAACLCNIDVNTYAPQGWLHAAQNLHWEHDSSMDYNPIYEGYKATGHSIKQSGAVLLGYPLMWNISHSTLKHNLRVYSEEIPQATSSTAWAMLAINWLALDQEEKAQQAFEKSYKEYVSEPYKTWMQYPNAAGSNYHSAMGSFIQTLLYGYGGLRIQLEHLYMNPKLPQGVHSMLFRDIDYLGSTFDIKVTSDMIHILVHNIGIYPLKLTLKGTDRSFHMTRGALIPLTRGPFIIKSKAKTECPLPDDNIIAYSTQYTPSAHISSYVYTASSAGKPSLQHTIFYILAIYSFYGQLSSLLLL